MTDEFQSTEKSPVNEALQNSKIHMDRGNNPKDGEHIDINSREFKIKKKSLPMGSALTSDLPPGRIAGTNSLTRKKLGGKKHSMPKQVMKTATVSQIDGDNLRIGVTIDSQKELSSLASNEFIPLRPRISQLVAMKSFEKEQTEHGQLQATLNIIETAHESENEIKDIR